VARELGIDDRGDALVESFRRGLDGIVRPAQPPRVLFLEWLIPPFSAGHWMAELFEAAGGIPVLADRGSHSRQLSWEAIGSEAFDVVVVSCCGFDVERTSLDVASCSELQSLFERRPDVRGIIFD